MKRKTIKAPYPDTQANYYKAQLKAIATGDDRLAQISPPNFKIRDEKGETKWMSLNKLSAPILVEWLKENGYLS